MVASGFKPEVKIDFVYTTNLPVDGLAVGDVYFDESMERLEGDSKFVLTKVRYYDELGDKMFFNLCFSQNMKDNSRECCNV